MYEAKAHLNSRFFCFCDALFIEIWPNQNRKERTDDQKPLALTIYRVEADFYLKNREEESEDDNFKPTSKEPRHREKMKKNRKCYLGLLPLRLRLRPYAKGISISDC